MKTLIVGTDNHRKEPIHKALWPIPQGGSGDRLRRLVEEHLGRDYCAEDFVIDFARTNLYPMRRAPNGRGKKAADLDALATVAFLSQVLEVRDIVLLGNRCLEAFNDAFEQDLTWLESRVIELPDGSIRRYWALPYPTPTGFAGQWYKDESNRQAASKLLGTLRNRA